MFSVESVESFLSELLGQDDTQYPNNICAVGINKPLEEILEGHDVHYDSSSKIIREP